MKMAVTAKLTFKDIPVDAAYIRIAHDSGTKALLTGHAAIYYSAALANPPDIEVEEPDGVDEHGEPKTKTVMRPAPANEPLGGFSFTVQRDLQANAYEQLYAALKLRLAGDLGATDIEDC